ncbi:hypothetical protein G6L28_15010 [Agrobacterium larrymoorei]|nr:hypothetical protein [Agrobacterium larrymoorei]
MPRDRLHADGGVVSETTSISGAGFGLLSLLVGAERGWITRQEALDRCSLMVNALGRVPRFHGAFPHFIHSAECTVIPFSKKDDGGDLVETTFLLQGLICARQYFDGNAENEIELRGLFDDLIQSVEWSWYTKGGSEGLWWHWSPKFGWGRNVRISGWNEALLVYVLATGAGAYSISPANYHVGWARNGEMVNGKSYLGTTLPLGEPYGGPAFLSQYSFCGLNPFRLRDRYCAYGEQVTAHARINHDYCRAKYGDNALWGLTSCDGPSGYKAYSPMRDGGIIAPTAALASFPFLPAEAAAALTAFAQHSDGKLFGKFGFVDAFSAKTGWVASTHLAIDQGPIVVMMENYRSGLLWRLFTSAPEVQRGLERLGFELSA